MAALVSIIVPVYNTAPYLEACVRSVLRQTYSNFELILADDGSDDGSGELCDRLSGEDGRIRVLHREHQGASAARNAAMRAAKGEYLFFLDSDDGIHPELLQSLCKLAKETGAAIVISDYVKTEEQEMFPETKEAEKAPFYLNNQEALRCFCQNKEEILLFTMIGGKLLHRSIVGDLIFDESIHVGEDTIFIYWLLTTGADMAVFGQRWYYYRRRVQSASHRGTSQDYYKRFQTHRYMFVSELEKGRAVNAVGKEWDVVSALVDGYQISRRDDGKESVLFWKELLQNEKKTPEFALIPWYSIVKLKYYLILYCYPLYLFLRFLWRTLKKLGEVCRAWLKKKSAPAVGPVKRSAK